MPIDPNIILQAKPQTFSPLEVLGQTVPIAQGINQAKLFGQEFGGKVASGQAAAGAVDPATGRLDVAKYLSALAGNPQGAFLVPEAAAQAQAREKEQLAIDAAQIELGQKRVGASAAAIYPLLATDPAKLTKADVWKAAIPLANMEVFKSPEALNGLVQTIQGLPEDGPALHQALTQFYMQANPNKEGAASALGSPTSVSTGARNIQGLTNPFTGALKPASEVGMEIAPSDVIQVYDPTTRQMVTKPKAQVFGSTGRGGAAGGPTGGVAAGPPMGAPEAASVTGSESAKQGINLQQQAEQAPLRRATLQSMRGKIGDFSSGPLADKLGFVKGLATQFGIAAPTGAIANATAAREEFNKLSTQIVLQQVAALGGAGTDDKLAAGIKGNPSEYLSRLGNEGVIALMIGNENAIEAKHDAWQKWSSVYGPESYGRFTQEFNKIYDPRVFQAAQMSPEERSAMLKSMTKEERKRYDAALGYARRAKWVD